jgi:predicted ATPase/class 3 adenylate cyclase/Tfp pilus assembly protein PilF
LRRDLPAGTVTFLFTDVEGSTKLLHELGSAAYAEKLAEHRRIVRDACTAQGGVEVDTQGDAFFIAFPAAPNALEAAREVTEQLASGPITLRIGLHTGTPLLTDEGYVGDDVHFAARVAASAHGGQVVLSHATRALLDERNPLVELGEHRLKDIPEPVAIFQLGDGQFPPLKTISNTNLPRPASSFVGRERELQELLARIESGARLVTLSGPGGSGKTRLALEAAATLVPEYKAGVFWVGLASLRDAALVTETIAQTLGAKDGLAGHIGERQMLLLLDNLEQVIEAAPELSSLLQRCPNLTLLVTSRELLRVQGEIEYPVLPLAKAEAISLFCERAQTAPTEDVAELCRRLDNLPLAVELAAARTKALSPAQILERLSQRLDQLKGGRDADPRQQTLRATIQWSYDLLTEEEQRLFRRLSVFSGGCTLEAAEEVANADLDALQSLVEKSLLRFSNERYWMLETIREYASDRLDRTRDPAHVLRAHLEHYVRLAEGAQQLLRSGEGEQRAFDVLDAEVRNLRAALGWAVANDARNAYRLGASLISYWYLRGLYDEAIVWCERVLRLPVGDMATARHRLLLRLAETHSMHGNFERAREALSEALEIAKALGDELRIGSCWINFGHLAGWEGNARDALRFYERAVEVFERAGDIHDRTIGYLNLGWALVSNREFRRADAVLAQALELARAEGSTVHEAVALNNLSHVALGEERFEPVESLATTGLRLAAAMGERRLMQESFELVARSAAARGDDARAARLSGVAERLREELGVSDPIGREDLIAASRARLGIEAWDSAFEAGRTTDPADLAALGIAMDLAAEGAMR